MFKDEEAHKIVYNAHITDGGNIFTDKTHYSASIAHNLAHNSGHGYSLSLTQDRSGYDAVGRVVRIGVAELNHDYTANISSIDAKTLRDGTVESCMGLDEERWQKGFRYDAYRVEDDPYNAELIYRTFDSSPDTTKEIDHSGVAIANISMEFPDRMDIVYPHGAIQKDIDSKEA